MVLLATPANWTRNELVLVLDLYRRSGVLRENAPEVQALSRLLRELVPLAEQGDPAAFRTPSSIVLRLENFAHLDPQASGGVATGARVDDEIWKQFGNDPDALESEVAQIRQKIPERSYWTWVANPNVFKVDDAVRERETDRWLTKEKPVKPGDRGVVWRSLGGDGKRGVIAIGEVISEPYMARADTDPYWIAPSEEREEFVNVRYVPLEGLPIWSGTAGLDELGLNADRARGGTLFHLEVDEWNQLLDIARSQRTGSQDVDSVTDTGRDVYVVRAGKGGVRSKEFEELELVAIGFVPAGDLSGLDKAGIKRAVEEGFEGDPAGRIRTSAWQLILFANSMRVGDLVVVPDGSSGPLLFGEITSEYEYLDPPPIENWRHVRRVRWLGRKDRASLSNKTRRSLGAATTVFVPDGQDELKALLFGTPRREDTKVAAPTMDWLEAETLWTRTELEELVRTLETSGPQVILAGPPGTGKTWVAEKVAHYLTRGVSGATRIVQFHPSYSYEDFIEGLRPEVEDGAVSFQRVDGVVLEMTSEIEDEDSLHVLVVDEMNRANLPRVLGELMYLFEYRDKPVALRYTKSFSLPPNLRFIGTMNTADRSIRSIDVALRRRFDIFECAPSAEILRRYYKMHTSEVENLIEGFENLNAALEEQLDRHHTIGHTFFMASPMTPQELQRVWTRKVGPLIEEYFFDQPDIAREFTLERYWP